MDIRTKKFLLEVYGILRMALGIGQIVGLFCGYFLLEWIIRYPSQALFVINEEVLALVCLVVFLKGVFHVVAGIGIARLQNWGRVWLLSGWPVAVILTIGLIFTLGQGWAERGVITGMSSMIIWPRVLVYIAVIVFDYAVVNVFIQDIEKGVYTAEVLGERLEFKKIVPFIGLCVLFFLIVLFLGRPVQKGFHQGYYKLKGETSSPAAASPVDNVPALAPKDNILKEPKVMDAKHIAIVVEENKKDAEAPDIKPLLEPMKKETKGDLPYRDVFGYLGGFLILAGFLLRLLGGQNSSAMLSDMLLCCGFILWVIYGLSTKQLALSLTSSMIALACLGIIFSKLKTSS